MIRTRGSFLIITARWWTGWTVKITVFLATKPGWSLPSTTSAALTPGKCRLNSANHPHSSCGVVVGNFHTLQFLYLFTIRLTIFCIMYIIQDIEINYMFAALMWYTSMCYYYYYWIIHKINQTSKEESRPWATRLYFGPSNNFTLLNGWISLHGVLD